MPQGTVRKYGRRALEAIHYGRIPLEALNEDLASVNYAGMLRRQSEVRHNKAYDMSRLEGKLEQLLEAYRNNGGTQVRIDENGFVAIYNEHLKNKIRINKLR